MRPTVLAALFCLAVPAAASAYAPNAHAAAPQAVLQKALNDPARAADKVDDSRRKIDQVMQFAEVKPGQSVLELVPGSGYWTRVFSGIVGPKGHVYTVWPTEMGKFDTESLGNWQKLVATPHYANVSILQQPAAKLQAPAPVDLVFTVQNYHDFHDAFMGPMDMAAFNHQVFDALKPGGLFVIIDHVAPAGSGFADTNTLHRIDPAAVKQEVEAAGFVFDGESKALHNAADPLDIKVFDKAIRGHTDQFIYRFRKPAK
ncbi:methyltransferase [Rhodanobacter sp. AS-Z3]|uniref:class I SAM-dependent methyltransferase n=1 Tax=Rhodanobacter sp. AS-Z3 TaxID=3031330 RepID=UPI00247A7F50|nr:methyltransferase [Rhodanobacter sp. AS-Z3]WEN14193.1 methyltransferase [Rhodanobacter sp. AS-Z3]